MEPSNMRSQSGLALSQCHSGSRRTKKVIMRVSHGSTKVTMMINTSGSMKRAARRGVSIGFKIKSGSDGYTIRPNNS